MSKYKVGDELRIREWNDMAAEFGLDEFGGVDCIYGFTEDMKRLCGMDFTVSKIDSFEGNDEYFSEEGIEMEYYWSISSDMLEPRTVEDLYTASDSEIDNLLFGE